MIISSTEPPLLRALGHVSQVPERYGVDILWHSKVSGLCGIQRKEYPGDFVASVQGGRLSKEIGQMQTLDLRVLLLEGRPNWTTDGKAVGQYVRWTKTAHRRELCSVQARGVWVLTSDNLDDTIGTIWDVLHWSNKPKHYSTQTRPKPRGDRWGRITNRDWQLHLIQGIDGVGPELAERILDQVGMPFKLGVTEDELLTVKGLGKTRAKRIVRAFDDG